MGLTLAGRYREAMAVYDRALALQPNSVQSLRSRAVLLAAGGRLTEALAVAQTIPLEPANPGGRVARVRVFAQAGMKAEAEALLPGFGPNNNVDLIECWLALGRDEEAVTRLDPTKLFANSVAQFIFDPFYDAIRNDPRVVKLMADLGLTEAHARAQAWRKAHPPEKTVAK
jgi:tetratricopeptide (TPR) repeat protein